MAQMYDTMVRGFHVMERKLFDAERTTATALERIAILSEAAAKAEKARQRGSFWSFLLAVLLAVLVSLALSRLIGGRAVSYDQATGGAVMQPAVPMMLAHGGAGIRGGTPLIFTTAPASFLQNSGAGF